MKKINLLFILITGILLSACNKTIQDDSILTGTIKVSYENKVNGKPLFLNGTVYANSFGENYSVTKFKYYISYTAVNNIDKRAIDNDTYHLIDESKSTSLSYSFPAMVENYDEISFWVGVDSTRNVSGAQTGALDPLNDMFWTWNSGYIMAKLEGTSPNSNQVNNKIEYHIGGFSGVNNVLKKINIKVPAGKTMNVKKDKTTEIIIAADIDAWWQNPTDLKIAVNPVCTSPGALAKKIADNYSKMFTIKDVINY